MNTRRFKTLGMTDEPGYCDLCGTRCPRRRVAVQLIGDDGSEFGDVQLWGVVCAAEARHGRRDSTLARQLREEAEEAGAYAGPTGGRRGPRPAVRRQTRREAERVAALDAMERNAVWLRIASPVPAGTDDYPAADYRYGQTGRPWAGSYYATDDAGQVCRIDGNDAADVERFTRRGFARLQTVTA